MPQPVGTDSFKARAGARGPHDLRNHTGADRAQRRAHAQEYRSTYIEIDHVVALEEAWDSEAFPWDDARRAAYRNDITDPARWSPSPHRVTKPGATATRRTPRSAPASTAVASTRLDPLR